MNLDLLWQLVTILAPLSLVAVGGGVTIIPEVHRQVVEVRGWLTTAEFAQHVALVQAVPGPNLLVVSLIGWTLAGWSGAVTALLAIVGPSSLLAFAVAHFWRRLAHTPWLLAIQRGLAPVAVGLLLSSGAILVGAAATSPAALLMSAVTVLLLLRTNIHPLPLMVVAAGLAVAGWL